MKEIIVLLALSLFYSGLYAQSSIIRVRVDNGDDLKAIKIDKEYIAQSTGNTGEYLLSVDLEETMVKMLAFSYGEKSFASYKIIIEPGKEYNVYLDLENRSEYSIKSNSVEDSLYRHVYLGVHKQIDNKMQELLERHRRLSPESQFAKQLISAIAEMDTKGRERAKIKAAKQHLNNYITPYLFSNLREYTEEHQELYDLFPDSIKNAKYGVMFSNKMTEYFASNKGVAPVFHNISFLEEEFVPIVGQTLSGEEMILDKDFFSNSDAPFTLIEFWASWCAPCRQFNKSLYIKQHEIGSKLLDVVLVSIDHEEEAWKNASEDDGYDWLNISDLQGQHSSVIKGYNLSGIPYNVLVNAEGKIIAKGVRSLNLLERIVSEY